MSFEVGTTAFALNPKYKDGTRLRATAEADSKFNGVWLPNDTPVTIVDTAPDFVRVRKSDGDEGWIRVRNLTQTKRSAGVTKGVIHSEIVTPDPEYVKGTKIYGVGIKEDPIPGMKFGKGIQHLISTYWHMDMSQFIATHMKELQGCLKFGLAAAEKHPGYDYRYYLNMANYLFNRAEVSGLKTQESLDFFLMATWLVMAAAEVDRFPFKKYTLEERIQQRQEFYDSYLNPRPGPGSCPDIGRDDAAALGKFSVPETRADLIPPIALERLGINNELSALKYRDPEEPMRVGFLISKRIDSLKRHFDSTHHSDESEDHVIHLLWNFMAIYHVNKVFPKKNDLTNYTAIREGTAERKLEAYSPTTSLEKIQQLVPEQRASALKLDWNEGVIPPPRSVRDALTSYINFNDGDTLKFYPELGGGVRLRGRLATYASCIPEALLVTNGSDDALILICHTFLAPGKVCLAPCPTYEHFCVNAEGTGATLIRFEPKDVMTNCVDEISAAIEKERPALVYLVSPNNPLGTEWHPHQVENLASRYPDVIFILDEAYHEFASIDTTTSKPSTCTAVTKVHKNVIVTRTFSKAFCLASLRCGYIIAHPNTIEQLRVLYNPKSVNQLAQIGCSYAIDEFSNYYSPYIQATNEMRKRFIDELTAAGVQVLSGGGGNFVCVVCPTGKAKALAKALEQKAIYIRDISARVPNTIRISIGLDMTRVRDGILTAIKEV
eukprot:PhF_6_TR37204/c0_g1_i1/m.54832/K00817/hisC; histidinol-phosphate aminotransferase